MIIERDLPIKMDDGVVLRADVYRPDTKAKVPIVMAGGPYGKGVKYQEHYKPLWESLLKMHPDILPGSEHRGSPGKPSIRKSGFPGAMPVCGSIHVVPVGPRAIWISSRRARLRTMPTPSNGPEQQSWSNGKVGLNGVSYYAINQWQVAALQPKHLSAMIPWEGAADHYRDWARHGGILSNKFMEIWYPRQVEAVQHGNAKGPKDRWMGESATGPAKAVRT